MRARKKFRARSDLGRTVLAAAMSEPNGEPYFATQAPFCLT
jgi:hypothetical protein